MVFLYNMERWGGRTLIARDCGGEAFDTLDVPQEPTPLLLHAPTALMLISLADLGSDPTQPIEALLSNYINALLSRGADFRRKDHKLIVVFTKSDLMQALLPPNLWHYVASDRLWTYLCNDDARAAMDAQQMQDYLEGMALVSETIRQWVGSKPWGKPFLCLADTKQLDMRFSVISSLWPKPASTALSDVVLNPRRVLDPFFWAVELQSR